MERYKVTISHGEGATLYAVVDTSQPEEEQPAVVLTYSTATEPNAEFLARDYAKRHNDKEGQPNV